ncbi:MAG: glycosyltransferase family 2 protein [Microbacteriaceae bacterium]
MTPKKEVKAKGSIGQRLELIARRKYDYPAINHDQLTRRFEHALKNYRSIAEQFQSVKRELNAIATELKRIDAARARDLIYLELQNLEIIATGLATVHHKRELIAHLVKRLRFALERLRLDGTIYPELVIAGFATLIKRATNLEKIIIELGREISAQETEFALLENAARWSGQVVTAKSFVANGFSQAGIALLFSVAYGVHAPTTSRRSALQELIRWAKQADRPELLEKFSQHLEFARVKKSLSRVVGLNFVAHQTARVSAGEQEAGEEFFVLIQTQRLKSELFHADNALWVSNFVGQMEQEVLGAKNTHQAQLEWINFSLEAAALAPIALSEGDEPVFERIESVIEPREVKSNDPLVTVIMPAYNSAQWITSAIKSVLAQSWQKFELIIVDDASTDSTLSIAKYFEALDPRVKVVASNENGGPYRCRNIALRMAAGDFITVHDADDWSHPEKIERQVEQLLQNPKTIANVSQGARMNPMNLQVGFSGRSSILRPNYSSLMFRREPVLRELGFWDEVRFGGDSEFQCRLTAFYGNDALQILEASALSLLRVVSTSLTAGGVQEMLSGARKLYKDSFLRWHVRLREEERSFFLNPTEPRRFYAPRASMKQDLESIRHELVVAANLASSSGDLESAKKAVLQAKELGLSVGVIHVPHLQQADSQIDFDFEAYCCANGVELLPNLKLEVGEETKFGAGLILSTVAAAQEIFDRAPTFEANQHALLVNSQRSSQGTRLTRAIENFETMYGARPNLVAVDGEAKANLELSAARAEIAELDLSGTIYALANQQLFQTSGD